MRASLHAGTWPWRVVLAVLLVALSYLALEPMPSPTLGTGWDKLNHVLAFMALAVAGRRAFPGGRGGAAVVAIALGVYGSAIEAVQTLVPGRSSEWTDLIADGVGIAAGVWLASWIARGANRP